MLKHKGYILSASSLKQILQIRFLSAESIDVKLKKEPNENDDSRRLHVPVLLNEVLKHIVKETPEFKVFLVRRIKNSGSSLIRTCGQSKGFL